MKRRNRFLDKRVEGLKDRPRRGRAGEITPGERAQVMALACTDLDDGSCHWSTRKLAHASRVSKSTVNRILNEASRSRIRLSTGAGKAIHIAQKSIV